MTMNIFYNKKGIGDTLIIQLSTEKLDYPEAVVKGDVAKIIHPETKKTIGFNIFNATLHFHLKENGAITVNEEMMEIVNRLIHENGFEDTLAFDFRPSFIIGHVETIEKHPNADKLNVCQVNIGDEILQIVCGAPNVDKAQNVVVARVGAMMPSGMMIKDAELRGIPSSGMICSAKELNLKDASEEKGILVLPEHLEVGTDFFAVYNEAR